MTFFPQRPVYPHDYPDMPESSEMTVNPGEKQTVKVRVNKSTHDWYVDKKSETEHELTIVIEPLKSKGAS